MKRKSSEAAMKLIMSSAFSSALTLLGISFFYGLAGSFDFSVLSGVENSSGLYFLSFALLLSGFAFKISAVPFHFWTADVYEGSPVQVTAFLSVLSKGAMLFVLVAVMNNLFLRISEVVIPVISVLAMITMVTGNLFALRQNNLKRFLAFSSIAQVGFILVGLSSLTTEGSASVVYFVLVYLFSNLAAFGVVAIASPLESINQLNGFHKSNPVLAWAFTIALFSLAGIPPAAGFFGKFFLLKAGASTGNYFLLTVAALNMVISLYYYLRIVRAMFMERKNPESPAITADRPAVIALGFCIAGILITGLAGGSYFYIQSLF
jgi:NADH-quinone oxidoreductase subunit N